MRKPAPVRSGAAEARQGDAAWVEFYAHAGTSTACLKTDGTCFAIGWISYDGAAFVGTVRRARSKGAFDCEVLWKDDNKYSEHDIRDVCFSSHSCPAPAAAGASAAEYGASLTRAVTPSAASAAKRRLTFCSPPRHLLHVSPASPPVHLLHLSPASFSARVGSSNLDLAQRSAARVLYLRGALASRVLGTLAADAASCAESSLLRPAYPCTHGSAMRCQACATEGRALENAPTTRSQMRCSPPALRRLVDGLLEILANDDLASLRRGGSGAAAGVAPPQRGGGPLETLLSMYEVLVK